MQRLKLPTGDEQIRSITGMTGAQNCKRRANQVLFTYVKQEWTPFMPRKAVTIKDQYGKVLG